VPSAWVSMDTDSKPGPQDTTLGTNIPATSFFDAWNLALHASIFETQTALMAEWQYLYDLGKSTEVFLRLVHVAVSRLTLENPVLYATYFQAAIKTFTPPHHVQGLQGPSHATALDDIIYICVYMRIYALYNIRCRRCCCRSLIYITCLVPISCER
jgi:hypothetical protein